METNPSRKFEVFPIGFVHSDLKQRSGAPRQADEGAPRARLAIRSAFLPALHGIEAGQEIWILTWLHDAERSVLQVRPRGEPSNPITGVFATRSPDRPNPIGLHRARVLVTNAAGWLDVDALEAIDGTPILDIKPILGREQIY